MQPTAILSAILLAMSGTSALALAVPEARGFSTRGSKAATQNFAKDTNANVITRDSIASFNAYYSTDCTGDANGHYPQTPGVCHPLAESSIALYYQSGSCQLVVYDDGNCQAGASYLTTDACWDTSTRYSYAVYC